MDEALAKVRVVMDISGRPSLDFNMHAKNPFTLGTLSVEDRLYDAKAAQHFFNSFVITSGINLHIDTLKGDDFHHLLEAVFKAFGRAMAEAVRIEKRRRGATPSTKGKL